MRYLCCVFLVGWCCATLSAQSAFEAVDSSLLVLQLDTADQRRLDTIRMNSEKALGEARAAYQILTAPLLYSRAYLSQRLDSLRNRNVSDDSVIVKLDSAEAKIAAIRSRFEAKIDSIRTKVILLTNVEKRSPDQTTEAARMQSMFHRITPSEFLDSNTSGIFPELNPSGLLDVNMPAISNAGIEGAVNVSELTGATNKLGDLSSGGIVDGLQKKANLTDASNLQGQSIDNVIESRLSRMDEVKELQQAGDLPGMGTLTSGNVTSELKNQVRRAAMNHFSGKQEQLKSAVDKVSRYKIKSTNLAGIKDVKEGTKGIKIKIPVPERIVYGLTMQVQRKSSVFAIDITPYAGLKFTNRLTGGLGWNQRIGYNRKSHNLDWSAAIFGPRTYGEILIGKGFFPRIETELMSVRAPDASLDPDGRNWVWGVYAGIKKDYRLSGRLRGTTAIMLRVFDYNRKSPYTELINIRFGFELPLRKPGKSSTKSRK